VAEILPAAKTRSFPDVAITLGRDERIDAEVLSFFEGPEKVITISPSAVIYSRSHAQNGENKHVELLVSTITRLIQQGKKVLLVPHTYSVVSHAPDICDYGVCLKILKNLPVKTPGLKLLEGDLSPKVLKSVVARAYIHIGGRYHSLVASLSTGVPSIALSWHHKYKDLLKQYGVANSIVDDREPDQAEHLLRLFDDLLTNHADIQALLQNKQRELGSYIDENVKLLVDSYNEIS
jgi:polysaccharide pyruvyl transferase WcaK-like protein